MPLFQFTLEAMCTSMHDRFTTINHTFHLLVKPIIFFPESSRVITNSLYSLLIYTLIFFRRKKKDSNLPTLIHTRKNAPLFVQALRKIQTPASRNANKDTLFLLARSSDRRAMDNVQISQCVSQSVY